MSTEPPSPGRCETRVESSLSVFSGAGSASPSARQRHRGSSAGESSTTPSRGNAKETLEQNHQGAMIDIMTSAAAMGGGGNRKNCSSSDDATGSLMRPLIGGNAGQAGGGNGNSSNTGTVGGGPSPMRKNSSDKKPRFSPSSGNALAKFVRDLVMMFFHCLVGAAVQVWQRGVELISNVAGSRDSDSSVGRGKQKIRPSDGHLYHQLATQDCMDEEEGRFSSRGGGGDIHAEMEVSQDEFGEHNVLYPAIPSIRRSSPYPAPSGEAQAEVLLEPEPASVLESAPHLLTTHMMKQIVMKGLPTILETKQWKRLFSVRRDGDSFLTFVNNVAKHKFTLLVVQSMEDDIFGAFVDTEWEKGHGFGAEGHQQFYGTGQSFLFKVDTTNTKNSSNKSSHPNVSIYKWTGRNDYNQLCSVDSAMLALGGGGASADFGLCVQDSFSRGSSGRCDTFDNPPLASRELFDILRFEVYGFVNHSY